MLLHELGGSIESWQWCDRQLGDRFRRILVDMPGAGPVVAEVARTLPRPVDSVIIPGAGHFPQIQAPRETAQFLTRFFLGDATA